MPQDPNKPPGPWRLNPARIVILVMGALVLLYVVSAVMGGLGNYQQLREASDAAKTAPAN